MKSVRSFCYLLILLLFASAIVNSQSRTGTTYTSLLTPQASLTRIGADALASGDASVAERGLATSAFTNPAGMQFNHFTAYAEFGKYTTSEWMAGFDYNGQFVAPAVVIVGMPIDDFSLCVGYFRQYSNRLSSGPIAVTTPAFPEGTGEFVSYEKRVELHSICGSASLGLGEKLSIGLTLGGNYVTHNEDLLDISVSGNDKNVFLIGGIDIMLGDDISIGASARYNAPLRYVPEMNAPQSSLGPVDTNYIRVNAVEDSQVEVRFPPIVQVGASWQALSWLMLLSSAEFQNWTTSLSYVENRWQFHAGGIVEVDEMLALRFGFFTESSPSVYNKAILDQQFITAGFHLRVQPVDLSFAVMDSHIFRKSVSTADAFASSEPFYQTYFSSGISITF